MNDSTTIAPSEAATCRICRSEGTDDEPLFHPCRCSGSIRNVHQECLVEWLSHSQKKHCELCKTPFRFTKLYDAQMPAHLPWGVFVKRALVHIINGTFRAIRALLVVTIWMVILPWLIRWAWRWMFWFADAGWARDIILGELSRKSGARLQGLANSTNAINETLHDSMVVQNTTTKQAIHDFTGNLLRLIGIEALVNTTRSSAPNPGQQPDASIFSSLSYISALTPYPPVNRILLDIFEGQLITCTVILAFILVFLIREWVVQQQPIVNLDQLREQREAAEIVRRRIELLEQARRTLEELEGATDSMNEMLDEQIEGNRHGATTVQDPSHVRPGMPDRNASSRALRVQRLIEEADSILGPQESTTNEGQSKLEPSHEAAETPPTHPLHRIQELPITNAGPDARLNIRRRKINKATAVPAKAERSFISNEELQNRLSEITSEETPTEDHLPPPSHDSAEAQESSSSEEPVETEALLEQMVPNTPTPNGAVQHVENIPEAETVTEPASDSDDLDQPERRPEDLLRQTPMEKLADWFWGDIQPNTTPEPNPHVDEQHLHADGEGNEAPFVPVVNHGMLPNNAVQQARNHDPEVVAAAQQAGLDAEAVDDAEDIEGLLELIGLQGPIAGLVQTSLFCLLLVVCTVAGAVVLPYLWGKLVIIIIDEPMRLLLLILRTVSGIGSLVIDVSILLGSWLLTSTALATEVLLAVLGSISPRTAFDTSYAATISKSALSEANASGGRLYALFAGSEGVRPYDFNGAILHGSAFAHQALKHLQAEVNVVLAIFRTIVQHAFEVFVLGNFDLAKSIMLKFVKTIPTIPNTLSSTLQQCLDVGTAVFASIKGGDITLPIRKTTGALDPALAYWSSTDRTLAVCAGYAAVACMAAIYVAVDTPITREWQKTEKIVRDSLRQAGGVFKVILIISIEMLVFPLYCGMLLDFAFLPLFADASITSRITFATTAPYVFCFVHWFIGTCYMFHFALFVGMCRKILRKGVLWFIRDPDDPTFHPVRDVLERNVTTQLRKIAFSALVYGALVILCLGGVIWGIGKVFHGIFPIYWSATEPTIEFPVDLLLYNLVTPLVIRLFKPSEIIHAMYAWWLRKCARMLRLSHFLFDDRRRDEEVYNDGKTWTGIARFLDAPSSKPASITKVSPDGRIEIDYGFKKDGQYVLTPCNDQYRPPKPGEAFLHVDEDDVYIADKDGKRNESFAKVFVPHLFKTRVTLFMVCLWIFSAFSGLCATLLPLVLGRYMLVALVPGIRMNDIYAYSLGAYALGGLIVALHRSLPFLQKFKAYLQRTSYLTMLGTAWSLAVRAAKVAYFYGFLLVLLPLMLGIIVETHIMIPLHTYFVLSSAGKLELAPLLRAAFGSVLNPAVPTSHDSTPTQHAVNAPLLMPHTMHIVQDLALGVLICRILVRTILSDRGSRASEVARRIKRAGRFRPDVGVLTRFVVTPATILSAVMLLAPPTIAWVTIGCVQLAGYDLSADHITMLYRFSYPAASATITGVYLLREFGKATARWRARIRDEVYLVGERLHNFGEKRPPAGSRSVMR